MPALPRIIDPNLQHAAVGLPGDEQAGIGTPAFAARLAAMPALAAELAPLNTFAQAAPSEVWRRLALVRVLEKYGLAVDAAAELRAISAIWRDAAWIKSWLFDLESTTAASARDVRPVTGTLASGKTYALLVGISDFKNESIPGLRFAHQDALSLYQMLRSPRGGNVPAENLTVLVNGEATSAAIVAAIESTIKARSAPGDTIMLFIASHGAVVKDNSGKETGYILASDSNPEELATSAIPMSDVRNLFEDELKHGHRLLLFVDVCHAGRIGQIQTSESRTNRQVESMAEDEGKFFGLLAAQGNQSALEGTQFGGGHGAFSQFLLEAWNGSADFNHDNRVTMDEFTQYVLDKVPDGTAGKQVPKQIGDIDELYTMAHAELPGIALTPFAGGLLTASRELIAPVQKTSRELRYEQADELQRQFDEALRRGNILPTQDQNAFALLRAIKLRLPAQYQAESTRLRVALEEAGQRVLDLYLRGETAPQSRDNFLAGSAYFEAAKLLASDSLYLDSRQLFCEGRALIFAKKYAEAIIELERSFRLDPGRSYSYNALGIAYLEQGNITLATEAFLEAVRRAPYWVYPLHNLALAMAEAGDYTGALRAYDRAMRLAPKAYYLPYNKGLLLEKIQQRRDAEISYRMAIALDNSKPDAYIGLGHLKASEGHPVDAERNYRVALDKDPLNTAARHNLALLLASRPGRFAEAESLWRQNLDRAPEFVASRLSLARALEHEKRSADAVIEYRALLLQKPDYTAARLAVAQIYIDSSRAADALVELRLAERQEPANAAIAESIGDAQMLAGDSAGAGESWRKALALVTDPESKKRLRRKAAAKR